MTTSNQKNIPALRFKEFDGEWEVKRLKVVIDDFIVPMRDKPKDLTGDIPWCRIEDFDGRYLSQSKSKQGVSWDTILNMNLKVFPINTLLVSCSAYLGRCAIVKKELITNQTFIGLVPNEKLINIEYLYYIMGWNEQKLNRLSSGTTISYLSRREFENFKIFIPSLPEQQKIARFLTVIDRKINQLSRKVQLQERYKKGVMQKLFSQELRFKDADGKDFAEWEEKRLGEVFSERNEKGYNEMDLLSISISKGIYKQSEGNKKDNSNSDKSKYKRVLIGDIAYNSMRMWQGASSVSKLNGIVSPAYTVLKGNELNNSSFYSYLFKMTYMIQTFQKYSQGLTSDTWNLKYPMLSKIKVVSPSLPEQQKIAHFLSQLDEQIQQTRQQLAHLQDYKKGLLQQLFV